MISEKSLKLALSILESFKEAENLYEDYQEADGFTNEDYDRMIQQLKEEIAECA